MIGMDISSNGKFIMTCSKGTDLVVWDLKGQKLAQIDTCLMSTTCAKISPCGRFIVASGNETLFVFAEIRGTICLLFRFFA